MCTKLNESIASWKIRVTSLTKNVYQNVDGGIKSIKGKQIGRNANKIHRQWSEGKR
jgi:hypothetical protein